MSEIYKALAKAQGEFLGIEKNRSVLIQTREKGTYTFRYADLDEILNKTRPALNKNGLALIQLINPTEQGLKLKCVLTHEGGETIESALPIAIGHGDPKGSGALITYYRRYLVTAILGVASDDDLDEDGQEAGEVAPAATGKAAVREPERKPKAQQNNQAPAAEGDATPGEVAFIGKKVTAANLTIQEAYKNAGLNFSEAPMTKAEFKALKNYLK